MHHPSPAAAVDAAADPTVSGRSLTLAGGWLGSAADQPERARLIEQARHTDAARQLRRCCPVAAGVLEQPDLAGARRASRATSRSTPTTRDSWRSRRRARAGGAAPPRHHRLDRTPAHDWPPSRR